MANGNDRAGAGPSRTDYFEQKIVPEIRKIGESNARIFLIIGRRWQPPTGSEILDRILSIESSVPTNQALEELETAINLAVAPAGLGFRLETEIGKYDRELKDRFDEGLTDAEREHLLAQANAAYTKEHARISGELPRADVKRTHDAAAPPIPRPRRTIVSDALGTDAAVDPKRPPRLWAVPPGASGALTNEQFEAFRRAARSGQPLTEAQIEAFRAGRGLVDPKTGAPVPLPRPRPPLPSDGEVPVPRPRPVPSPESDRGQLPIPRPNPRRTIAHGDRRDVRLEDVPPPRLWNDTFGLSNARIEALISARRAAKQRRP